MNRGPADRLARSGMTHGLPDLGNAPRHYVEPRYMLGAYFQVVHTTAARMISKMCISTEYGTMQSPRPGPAPYMPDDGGKQDRFNRAVSSAIIQAQDLPTKH